MSAGIKALRIGVLFIVFLHADLSVGDASVVQEDDGNEEICLIYITKNYTGEPVLSLRTNAKVFESSLVFELEEDSGIDVGSVALKKANCSLVLCDGKHLEGDCTQYTDSASSISDEKVYKNVRSVDCHCSLSTITDDDGSSKPNSNEEVRKIPLKRLSVLPPRSSTSRIQGNSGWTNKLSSNSASTTESTSFLNECANLFRNWHYEGQSYPLIFAGSTGRIDKSLERVRSVSVKPGCTAMLWGGQEIPGPVNDSKIGNHSDKFVSFSESTSFISPKQSVEFDWVCCYCDTPSKNVCRSAHTKSTSNNINGSYKENAIKVNDFSQFVKFGKKIIGIGRNYRWKKNELAGILAIPTKPIVFLKPTTSYLREGNLIQLPQSLGTIFYELELGVVIGKVGRNVSEYQALDHVAGYFLALDMTAKNFINQNGSLPWEIGKGFDTACPVGDFIPKSLIPDPSDVYLEAIVNGEITQSDSTKQMILTVQQLISYVSKYMTLEPYDVILTGTPDGFGPLKGGDVIKGRLGNITTIEFSAVSYPV